MSQWTSDINKISGLLRILLRKLLSCEIDIRATTPNFKWTPETADTRGPEPWIFLWLVSLQIIVVTPHDFVMNYLSWNTHFPPRLGWDDPDGPRSRTPGAPGTQYWKIAKWLIRWLILKYHDIMFVPFLHGLSLNLKCYAFVEIRQKSFMTQIVSKFSAEMLRKLSLSMSTLSTDRKGEGCLKHST